MGDVNVVAVVIFIEAGSVGDVGDVVHVLEEHVVVPLLHQGGHPTHGVGDALLVVGDGGNALIVLQDDVLVEEGRRQRIVPGHTMEQNRLVAHGSWNQTKAGVADVKLTVCLRQEVILWQQNVIRSFLREGTVEIFQPALVFHLNAALLGALENSMFLNRL